LISFEKPERFHSDGKYIRERCNKEGIDWHPLSYTKRPPVLSTVFDIWKMKRKFREINSKKKVDLLHCRSYISAFLGMKYKNTIPWIFDMRGFWADERVEGNIWNIEKPLYKRIYRFFKKKELQFFTGSSAIVSLTHAGKKEILSWKALNLSGNKISVIPCCVDLNLFDPKTISTEAKESKKQELGISDNKIVGYVGSIGTWYMLEEMLGTFKKLKAEAPNSLFLFVTREPEEMIIHEALKFGLPAESIKVVSALHKEVPLYISLFDCSIFYIKPSFSKTASSPTKQGELMAMGIPVICNSGVGDTAYVIEKYRGGLVLDLHSNDTDNISFSSLGEHFDQNAAMQGASEFYSLKSGIDSYEMVYNACLSAQK
jgi:glycosyltransferase involved in cell wall biosynthesis